MILQCTQHVLQWEETLKLDPFPVLVGDMRVEEVEALVASDPAVVGNNTAINQTNGARTNMDTCIRIKVLVVVVIHLLNYKVANHPHL